MDTRKTLILVIFLFFGSISGMTFSGSCEECRKSKEEAEEYAVRDAARKYVNSRGVLVLFESESVTDFSGRRINERGFDRTYLSASAGISYTVLQKRTVFSEDCGGYRSEVLIDVEEEKSRLAEKDILAQMVSKAWKNYEYFTKTDDPSFLLECYKIRKRAADALLTCDVREETIDSLYGLSFTDSCRKHFTIKSHIASRMGDEITVIFESFFKNISYIPRSVYTKLTPGSKGDVRKTGLSGNGKVELQISGYSGRKGRFSMILSIYEDFSLKSGISVKCRENAVVRADGIKCEVSEALIFSAISEKYDIVEDPVDSEIIIDLNIDMEKRFNGFYHTSRCTIEGQKIYNDGQKERLYIVSEGFGDSEKASSYESVRKACGRI